MSATYQSLKPPETQFEDEYSDDNSIQGSPLLNTGPVFSADNYTVDDFNLPPNSYHADEEYEDDIYAAAIQSNNEGSNYTPESENPYSDHSDYQQPPAHSKQHFLPNHRQSLYQGKTNLPLSPIIEPLAEHPSSSEGNRSANTSANSFHSQPLSSGDGSPSINLRFKRTRERPKSALISSSFRVPSGNVLSEPTTPSVLPEMHPSRRLQRQRTFTRRDKATPSPKVNEDEDTLPFEDTKRMAMQGRPHSMILLSSASEKGKIMDTESFENYRKSVVLDRESSLASVQLSPSRNRSLSPIRREPTYATMKEGDDDEADENEKERKRKSAKLRQEQDARMSVYRQSMMRLIGDSPGNAASDGESLSSIRALNLENKVSMDQDEEDDDLMDDIPINILQAHRFPKSVSTKPNVSPRKSGTSFFTENRSPQDGTNSVKSAPLTRSSPELGTFPRPISIASSRMLPNVTSASPKRPQGRLPPGAHSQSPVVHNSFSTIFGNKDNMLSRGLIGEISREEDVRRKRHTIGYGVDTSTSGNGAATSRGIPQSPSSATLGSIKDRDALQDKLDMVIQMLAKMSSQDSPVSAPPGSFMNPTIQQIHKASSISSFNTFDQFSGSNANGHRSPSSLGMGEFTNPVSIPFPPPIHQDSIASPLFPPYQGATQSRPISGHNLNRPSQMRLVNRPRDNEDEDDDDTQLQKLREERERLKNEWMEKTKNNEVPELITQTSTETSSESTGS